jgi:hypothetical protein
MLIISNKKGGSNLHSGIIITTEGREFLPRRTQSFYHRGHRVFTTEGREFLLRRAQRLIAENAK